MSGFKTSKIAQMALLAASSALISSCASSTPQAPQPTVKQAVETAPADLQLACASQAATQFSTAGSILPINSELTRKDVYNVQLTSQTGGFVCEIDKAGTILSIIPAAVEVPAAPAPAS